MSGEDLSAHIVKGTCSYDGKTIYASVANDDYATLDSIDRNARAYGWEIAHRWNLDYPLPDNLESSPGNPFIDPNWRENLT